MQSLYDAYNVIFAANTLQTDRVTYSSQLHDQSLSKPGACIVSGIK